MKLSKIIKGLQATLKESGDVYVREFLIDDEKMRQQFFLTSKTRKNKDGCSAKMTLKEFKAYVKEAKS